MIPGRDTVQRKRRGLMPSLAARLMIILPALAMLAGVATAAPVAPLPVASPPDAPLPGTSAGAAAAGSADRSISLGEDEADRLTLPVHIAGEGPFPFLIDTGSQRSIVALDIARRLDLPVRDPVIIVSLTGRSQVDSVNVPHLRYGKEEVQNLDALVIARGALGGAGLIGLDSLKGKRVHFNFRRRLVDVTDSASRQSRIADDPEAIVVRGRSRYGQLVLVDSKIGKLKVNVVVDTGAQVSIGNMALFHRLKAGRLLIPPTPVSLLSVTGEEVSALYSMVKQVTVGAVTLENVPMVFVDAAPFAELDLADRPAMLLGMGMLRMFDSIAIDFGRRRVDFVLPRSEGGRDPARLAKSPAPGPAMP
jgi:predicted aspartyl protease